MNQNLIIVESPAKVKTIKKFLGSNYNVEASGGHVRDLPKSQLGIDVEHEYEPKYITIRGKGEVLANLRKKVKKAKNIYLATDPDREGEAIAWHLTQALKLDDKEVQRITFNEITKSAVKESLARPRSIDMNLVDAQQTRRILDRIVGYTISPLLWQKVKRGLSAGRVQSAALAMVCRREEEINSFIPEEFWTLEVKLTEEGGKKEFMARYCGKAPLACKEDADKLIAGFRDERFYVCDVKKTRRVRKAPLPFTTSTLQQEASRRLNYSTQKTMRIAQQLYEGIDIMGNGTVGIITYLRTDSTRVAEEAKSMARDYILQKYGPEYVPDEAKDSQVKRKIQDAHEAIRPTDLVRTPESLKDSLNRDQLRLYKLIWERFAASQMRDATYDNTTVKIKAGEAVFSMSANVKTFDGYLSVYEDGEKLEKKDTLGGFEKDMQLELKDIDPKQHFTQPPAHYTEASLVRSMEECGIGRPSTYAPTITTLLARHYITKESKNIFTTEIGETVNNIMKGSFPDIVDEGFTAEMEEELDKIADGQEEWKQVVADFYPGFKREVDKAESELDRVTIADEVSDTVCELCGRNMVIKYGPHGKFLACPGFPECRNTKPYLERTGMTCPECGGELIIRRTRKGRRYFGCENYPECEYMSWSVNTKTDSDTDKMTDDKGDSQAAFEQTVMTGTF